MTLTMAEINRIEAEHNIDMDHERRKVASLADRARLLTSQDADMDGPRLKRRGTC